METVHPARPRRRQSLSLRHLGPVRSRRTERDGQSVDSAFESFYRDNVKGVYQYALAVLANPTDAEDVTQQTFLNAYRAFQRGERPRKPHNWLIKIAHNVCRMRWREAARRPQELPLDEVREPVKPEDDRAVTLDEVLAALAQLPFNQRAALVMRELEDRSYAEIAEVLGTSVSAVEALLFRARTNLRASRKVLGALTLVPVPGSLSSFFGSGGSGLVAAGGTAIGAEIILKAAAVVATGVVVGGLGYKGVDAVATAEPNAVAATQRDHGVLRQWAAPAERFVDAAAANGARASRSGYFGVSGDIWRGNQLRSGHRPGDPDGDAAADAPGAAAAGAASGGSAAAPASAAVGAASAAGAAVAPVSGAAPSAAQVVGSTTAPVTSVVSVVPSAPSAPAPSAPAPSVPVVPAPAPALPLPPAPPLPPLATPSLPSAPSAPSLPSAPALPSAPSLPSVPKIGP